MKEIDVGLQRLRQKIAWSRAFFEQSEKSVATKIRCRFTLVDSPVPTQAFFAHCLRFLFSSPLSGC